MEFSRRAATGEHAFFQIARRAPAHAMSSVAILDAGPLGLGAPRIAHLATLIVLAARAVTPDGGGRDIYVDYRTLQAARLPALEDRQRVQVVTRNGAKGPVAVKVMIA